MKHANDEDFRMEQLSALADGELGPEQVAALVQASRQDASMLQTWGSYHAIGDALRAHARDAQTSGGKPLAAQLPRWAEPPVAQPIGQLASRPAAANDALFRWKLVAGVAALAAVGSVVWALTGAQGGPVGPQLAQRGGPAATAVAPVATVSADALPASAATASAAETAPVMIRDARLDELLAAHKQFGGASALQQPAGFLRNATFQQAGR